jgi:hypothetical protein
MEITENLRQFLESGADWERKPTSVPGVSIIRLPASGKKAARLGVEINPMGDTGKPMKRQGVIVMSNGEHEAFQKLFNEERVARLLVAIEALSPESAISKKGSGDVLEI